MKKIIIVLLIVVVSAIAISCGKKNSIDNLTNEDIYISDNMISKKFYTKNLSDKFSNFIEDSKMGRARTAAELGEEETDFSEIWDSLSSEEKQLLMNNSEDIEVIEDSLLSIKSDSSIGRAIMGGDTTEIDSIVNVYSYSEWLNEHFGDIKIALSPEEYEFIENEKLVPMNFVIDYLSKSAKWDDIDKLLSIVNSAVTVEDVREEYKKIESALDFSKDNVIACRASKTVDYQDKPIREDVGLTLKDGTVMLTCFKNKAFPVIGGQWAHAGIFSKEAFEKNDGGDSSHCIYTAQPDEYDDFPDYMKPDRTNRCCLDTVYMYSYQKKMATLLPFDYSRIKAEKAVNYASDTFYNDEDENAYHIPVSEFFRIGDTSHNLKATNPYCSKVVYSAWKEAGVDLDSNTFGGNLVTPDDLYGSAFNRYRTITIRILFWSKTWTKKIYSGTSILLTNERQ